MEQIHPLGQIAGGANGRYVPVRRLPVPATVSVRMQALIARPLDPAFNTVPSSTEAWKARIEAANRNVLASLPALRERLGVTVEPTALGGVSAFLVTPKAVQQHRKDVVLLHLHGGVRVFNGGEAGTREAILMAGLAGFRVISVDYRMPPDFPFPAAPDDALAAYRALLETADARRIGLFGSSAGGSLVYVTLLRARAEGLPMPGAIATGSPTVDLSGAGDSLATHAGIDNVLGTHEGFVAATVQLYAAGRDPRDPLLSPAYGAVEGFPPAILTSGTRDLYLSNTVRMHRRLRDAGVQAELQLWEGQSHVQYMADPEAPETREYHDEVARFLDHHLTV
ncbi:alpha/beta hydrolase fold domain-containing protein [Sabulicella rubraurantiaca]|uniref:alpha/beta hydrolase fold domain-containing protein n=1 Tax=Sabulicella rubraurantiaca TaxID=2811429 RepID=UPI001A958C4C|nr:alpha/beta hydrolase [Sabulicella rubraurantiaca]